MAQCLCFRLRQNALFITDEHHVYAPCIKSASLLPTVFGWWPLLSGLSRQNASGSFVGIHISNGEDMPSSMGLRKVRQPLRVSLSKLCRNASCGISCFQGRLILLHPRPRLKKALRRAAYLCMAEGTRHAWPHPRSPRDHRACSARVFPAICAERANLYTGLPCFAFTLCLLRGRQHEYCIFPV